MIAVFGGAEVSPENRVLAEDVGREIARAGAVLICGGLGGAMEAACQGAKTAGGFTIGILPGADRSAANPWVDLAIATGLGAARNLVIAGTASAAIALDGRYGTLSEIAFALLHGRPVVGLATWDLAPPDRSESPLLHAETPVLAVRIAIEAARRCVSC